MKRFAAMQDWPEFTIRDFTPVESASSSFALGITINGSLPPSSSTLFFSSRPAALATALPARSLPVSVTAFTRGSRMTFSTASFSISKAWKTPSSNPASRKIFSIARAHCGTLDACLSRPTLPAIKAGAANRKTCQKGKFHGMIARMIPNGS